MNKHKARKPIGITRADGGQEGEHLAVVEDVRLLEEKRKIRFDQDEVEREILRARFKLKNGQTKYRDMIFVMTANSELGKFIKAIKGYLPDSIADIAEEVVGEEIVVDIAKNDKGNKTYYNIVGFKDKSEYKEEAKDTGLSSQAEIDEFLNGPSARKKVGPQNKVKTSEPSTKIQSRILRNRVAPLKPIK